MIHHGADRVDGQPVIFHLPHIDQEHREAGGARLRLLARRGARQQQHEIGMLGARGPDLLAVDHIMIAVADGGGAQAERIGARRRLGHTECLQAQFAERNARQIAFLLRGAAMAKKRAHRVHLRMTGRAVAAGGLDFLHDGGGRGHGQSAATVLFRYKSSEKASFGQRRDELGRIGALAIEPPPIFAGKIGAQCPHRFADRGEIGCVSHGRTSARPLLMAMTSRSTTRARKLTISPSRHISVRMVSPGKTGAEKRQANDASRAGS